MRPHMTDESLVIEVRQIHVIPHSGRLSTRQLVRQVGNYKIADLDQIIYR